MDVILVDDDPLILSLISEVLKQQHFNVRAFASAEEAWQSYQANPVHFVIADLILPGMDGIELVQHIRAHQSGEYCHLMVITVRDQPQDLQEVLRAGADDYLTKPVDINLISIRLTIARQQISQLLARKQIEKELNEARELAEVASKVKSQFMSVMTHELRTPLNAIVGFNDLLSQTTQLDQEQRIYCDSIHQATHNLLNLLGDVMDYSQLDNGKMNLLSIPFDLELCIQEAIDSCLGIANEKSLDILVDYHPKLPTRFLGDPKKIRRILHHLLDNAVKFTKQGEILLSVNEYAHLGDTLYLRLKVEDTGIGIAADQYHTIFNDFTQIDGTLQREYNGPGMGLAITHKLIKSMGGDIALESQLGKGSCFTLSLPLINERQIRSTQEETKALSGMSILILDDNRSNCRILCQYAEAFSMQCDYVHSQENVMAKITSQAYDFAILDYDMLEEAPTEFWRQLRQKSQNNNIKLILMCSTGKNELFASMKSYVSAFVYKPITQSQLLDVLTMIHGGWGESQMPQLDQQYATQDSEKPLQILLVEDNDLNRQSAHTMLSQLNCVVTESHHGLQAVQKMDEQDFDLILMDVRMPNMDGLEATRRIRLRGGTNNHIPIIAMTAESMQGDRERCLRAGMDDYLNKPINLHDLQSMILKWRHADHLN